jgi:hypothetical protein
MLTLRPMRAAQLDLVRAWLADPDVAAWYLVGSSIDEEVEDLSKCITGDEPTEVLLVCKQGQPIGWCQWWSATSGSGIRAPRSLPIQRRRTALREAFWRRTGLNFSGSDQCIPSRRRRPWRSTACNPSPSRLSPGQAVRRTKGRGRAEGAPTRGPPSSGTCSEQAQSSAAASWRWCEL